MGKASKWFRGLFGFKKSDPNQKPPPKKRWSFAKSHNDKDHLKSRNGVAPGGYDDEEGSRHSIAVAAATAVAADAAVAAAQAAAAVVKLTRGGGNTAACGSKNGVGYGRREECAAVIIQSHFRAYLSRRALRALKALVKLQALVRGHILRKQNVNKLRRMQAIVRAQARARARARAGRVLFSQVSPHSSTNSSPFNHTVEKLDDIRLARRSAQHQHLMMLKRNGSKSSGNVVYDPEKSHSIHHWIDRRTGEKSWEQGSFMRIVPMDDERSDKILEIDTGKPYIAPKSKKISHSSLLSDHSYDRYYQSFSMSNDDSTARQPLSPLKFVLDVDGNAFCTADNSPQYYSASSMGGSSKRAPFTPTKSDGSRSFLSGYSDHPSYMAYTESSKAKVRSLSAPKQRTDQCERSSSTNRHSVHGYGDSRPNTQKVATLHANFANKAYPGSGRLDRLGIPVRDVSGFSGGQWHRH